MNVVRTTFCVAGLLVGGGFASSEGPEMEVPVLSGQDRLAAVLGRLETLEQAMLVKDSEVKELELRVASLEAALAEASAEGEEANQAALTEASAERGKEGAGE